MISAAKTVIETLNRRGYEAYFIGGKPRNELHNKFFPNDRVEIKDVDIVTNATPDDIQKIFKKNKIQGVAFQVVNIYFAGFNFEIATYRHDNYDHSKTKKSKKIQKPIVEIAKDLDNDRMRRDYTINTVAQDVNDEFIDYQYKYRNKKISAIKDIENKIIRTIGNVRLRFEEDPLRILRGFRFMSHLGYKFENQTLKILGENIELLEKVPHERLSMEMNKIILGAHASKALKLMRDVGIFNLKITSNVDSGVPFLFELGKFSDSDYELLDKLNAKNKYCNNELTAIEAWAVLLRPLGEDTAIKLLSNFQMLCNNDIEKTKWLIQNYDLVNSDDMRNDLFNARTGIVKKYEINALKDLILRLNLIHIRLFGKSALEKTKKLMFSFCSRPYFHNQLNYNGQQLSEIANKKPGPWLDDVKEKILYKLINCDLYPRDEDAYLELVNEAINECSC